jgi:hypothetical protein
MNENSLKAARRSSSRVATAATAQGADFGNDIARSAQSIALQSANNDVGHRKMYAYAVLLILVLQLAFSNYVFFEFASHGRKWDVQIEAIIGYLAAMVVEVIGLVFVVVRYLFFEPASSRRDADRAAS